MNTAKLLLKKHFGYDDFRAGQSEIISHILNKEDCLGIMPTGAGKSICYQIPSLIFSGTTIVISPLISLMKDQVDSLNDVGIPSAFINSTLTSKQYINIINDAKQSLYKIIYVAPERLTSESFLKLLDSIEISMIAIDEAHCVSQWGHDFRPSYREIANVIVNLKTRPVVTAFTATATELVKNDIIDLLKLNNPFTLTTGFDRKNLHFAVKTPENRKKFVIHYLKENNDKSGIIYCLTRKTVDSLYEELNSLGFNVTKYHGGMTEKQRTVSQEDFVYDKANIMIATNAFGMGIDKSNIRYVLHYNMPKDLESYYQEAGRGGRDGDKSECILLFSRVDIVTNKFLIEQTSLENVDHSVEYQKLNDIVDYCNTDKCLRKYILEYFGEVPSFDNCSNCSNCNSHTEITDITIDAKKILSCIKRMHERFGSGLVTDVLKGSNTAKIRSMHFDSLSTYGIMSEYSKDTIKDLISFLVTEDYIKYIGDQYPILALTPRANNVLFHNETVTIKRKIEKDKPSFLDDVPVDVNLFALLTSLRKELSLEYHVPPFIIFTDVTLKQMSTNYPTSETELLNIEGVGKYKVERYGDAFIEVIQKYVEENNIIVHKEKNSPKSDDKLKKEKVDTKLITYNLYLEGKTIDEIAKIRNFTRQTIESHLLKCYKLDMNINLEKDIKTQYKDDILNAIHTIGTEKLRPIKDSLPSEVSYMDIQYYIINEQKDE